MCGNKTTKTGGGKDKGEKKKIQSNDLSVSLKRFDSYQKHLVKVIRTEINLNKNLSKTVKNKKKQGNVVGNLQQLKKSVCNTIDQCFQVLHQIDGYSATDDNDKKNQEYDEWRHGLLKQLVPKLSNVNCNEGMDKEDTSTMTESKIEADWARDSDKLNAYASSNDQDLELYKYFEAMELIQVQEQRLKKQVYAKVAECNRSLYANQVSLLCTLSDVLQY